MEGNSNEDLSNLDLTEFFDWEEFEKNSSFKDDEISLGLQVNLDVCICAIPSTEQLIECQSDGCPKKLYHAACVGQPLGVEGWRCNLCETEGPLHQTDPSPSHRSEEVMVSGVPQSHTSTPDPQHSKKMKMKYPVKTFQKANATVLAPDIMGEAVRDTFTNELFKLSSPFAEMVVGLARKVENIMNSPSFLKYSEETICDMWRVANHLRGKVWTDKVKGDMWQAFHCFRGSTKTVKRWGGLLDELEVERETEVEVFLLQHILDIAFRSLLKTVMETDMPTPTEDTAPQHMEANEEQALRYCCGYVPFKLRKRYRKMKGNEVAETYVAILSSWADDRDMDAESLLDYTEKWLKVQNRGGLFRVKNDVFLFFRAAEYVVRTNVHIRNIDNLQDINLHKFLLNNMLCNRDILSKWRKITGSLVGECSSQLLTEVLKCFIKMSCESFIKVYLFIRKASQSEGKVSKKAEKGLRRSLAS